VIPELSGKRVTLVPMRIGEAELMVRWAREQGMGGASREEVLQRWPPVMFDDAYPMKGRVFRIDERGAPVGAVVQGEVWGEPRNCRIELVLGTDAAAEPGSDAIDTLSRFLFEVLRVPVLWAELPPGDARGLAAFAGAGFELRAPTAEGKVVLRRERPQPKQQKGQIPPRD
jgi:hypothetical protein